MSMLLSDCFCLHQRTLVRIYFTTPTLSWKKAALQKGTNENTKARSIIYFQGVKLTTSRFRSCHSTLERSNVLKDLSHKINGRIQISTLTVQIRNGILDLPIKACSHQAKANAKLKKRSQNNQQRSKKKLQTSKKFFACLGCIYTRVKATSLPICCIVFNLYVYITVTAVATKIKEKIAFALV